MKVRAGFVSNSSSSSFIIGVKGDNLDLESLIGLFQVPPGSPLYKVASDLAQVMVNLSTEMDEEEMKSQFGYQSLEEAIECGVRQAKLIQQGFKVYSGYASDDDGGVEAMLCSTPIDFESDDLVVFSEGGY